MNTAVNRRAGMHPHGRPKTGTHPDSLPDRVERSDRTQLSAGDLENIVEQARAQHGGDDVRNRQRARIVAYNKRKYKVIAFKDDREARQRLSLASRFRGLFAECHGRVENRLIWEYVDGQPEHDKATKAKDIGEFLTELAVIPTTPLRDDEFEYWCRGLESGKIFLPISISYVRRFYEATKSLPAYWDYEYLDAVPKNFIYGSDGALLCVDIKHLHPGPRGLSLIKLFYNVGEYCRPSDYAVIKSTYERRLGDRSANDPRYKKFLLFYYCLFFLALNGRRHTRQANIENSMNWERKKTVLEIAGLPGVFRLLERLWWGGSSCLFWLKRLPGRLLRFAGRHSPIPLFKNKVSRTSRGGLLP